MQTQSVAMQTEARFELRSGDTWRNPFPMYAALRKHDPVHHVAAGDCWVLTRFDDVCAAAGDPATFSSAQGLTVSYDELVTTGLGDTMPMVFLDPPAHTEFRRLVTKGLTPRRVSSIEPAVRAFAVERLKSARVLGQVDIVSHLFQPLPDPGADQSSPPEFPARAGLDLTMARDGVQPPTP
jgi:cytochrome P450 family 130